VIQIQRVFPRAEDRRMPTWMMSRLAAEDRRMPTWMTSRLTWRSES